MKSRSIALSSLFGIVISTDKILLPPPYDKMISVVLQITFLSLAFFLIGFAGPVLTGFTSGLLTALFRGGVGVLSFSFALLYGIMVGSFNHVFAVLSEGTTNIMRLLISSLASTLLVGALSAYTSILIGVMPYEPSLILIIMVAGGLQGIMGSYLSAIIWEKYLRNAVST